MKTIQQIAGEVCDNMVSEDRNGYLIYHQKKPGEPQWIQDMIRSCHYSMMFPDNFVFEHVYKFCDEISRLGVNDDPRCLEIGSYIDDYTHDLLKWLSSNLVRLEFVEDVIDERYDCGDSEPSDFSIIMMRGQEKELDFILQTIVDHLEDRVDDENGSI